MKRVITLGIAAVLAMGLFACGTQSSVSAQGASEAGITESAGGRGPERDVFTMESPATYATFNSITDNPTIGDERDFVRVGAIDAKTTDLGDSVDVEAGKQYLVYIYYHNNASTTYNDAEHDNAGVALKTRLSVALPDKVSPDSSCAVQATITADNASPQAVWDSASFASNGGEVSLSYVEGSAHIYNDWGTNGTVLPSSLFTEEGALLGLDELDGVVPGCDEYHGIVTFVVQAA